MSIASRITAITGHITDIYDTLELGGDTTQNKNIVNINTEIKREYKDFLANGTDTLWNNWEKVNATNVETTSLTPTIKGKMKVDLKGNAYQEQTTQSKNLFDKSREVNSTYTSLIATALQHFKTTGEYATGYFDLGTRISNNVDFITSFTPCQSGTTYTIKNTYPGNLSMAGFIDDSGNVIDHNSSWSSNAYTHTATSEEKYIICGMKINVGGIDYRDYVQIEIGSSATSYVPFVPNSPSPDYPQPIQVVSGDNTIKVEGKNLWNENTQTFTNQARFATSKDSNNVWTFTITGSNGYAFAISNITLQAGTYTASATVNNGDFIILKGSVTQPNTFTLTEETEITFRVYKNGNVGDIVKLSNVMIEKNNQATNYTPYVAQTYPISLGNIELCKIGTYQDKIYKDNGKWYLNKQIGKVVLAGSESWNVGTRSDNTTKFFYRSYNEILTNNTSVGNEYSNYFRIENPYTSLNDSVWLFKQGNATALRLGFSNQDIITEAGLQSWLTNHNTTIYYPLATPTYEEITDTTLLSQLEAIKYSYDSQTNISQVNDDMSFVLDITALKEIS